MLACGFLAYVVPFAALVVSFGFRGLALTGHYLGFQSSVYREPLLRLADACYSLFALTIYPVRVCWGLLNPGSHFLEYEAIQRMTVDGYFHILKLNWVTFVCWMVLFVAGDLAWRRCLRPGVGASRRAIFLWVLAAVTGVVWIAQDVWRIASGLRVGRWSRGALIAVPLLLGLQWVAVGVVYRCTRREGGGQGRKLAKKVTIVTSILSVILGCALTALAFVLVEYPLD
ncbi:hypothetical protein D6833_05210 [Candidatus Parcubacteria bacterium]|nr:MAG: hypothetical protein D6833_05210 [Candidatus Parcubacteria bacterium]